MKICSALVATSALSVLAGSTAQAGMLIDSFNTTQSVSVGPGGGNPLSMTDGVMTLVESIGGARVVQLTRTEGMALLSTRVNIENGIFGFGAEPAVGGNVTVWYDGDTDASLNGSGLGGVDFTEGGLNQSIRVAYRYDLAIEFRVRVYTDDTNFSDAVFTFSGASGFNVPFNEELLTFASFVPTGGAGADFTNVGALEFYAQTDSMLAADFQLDYIELTQDVPAPSALGAFALAGIAAARRRRR